MIFSKKRKVQKLLQRRAWLEAYIEGSENLPKGIALTAHGSQELTELKAEYACVEEQLAQLSNAETTTVTILGRFTKKGAKI